MAVASLFPELEPKVFIPELVTIKLSEVVFEEDIYPRAEHYPELVQQYAETMESIEARRHFISVTTNNRLLDGKHRWLAYRKLTDGADREIQAYKYPVSAWLECFDLANDLNGEHGKQTDMRDKERNAKRYYQYGVTTYEEIAKRLHVGKKKISEWLSRTVKEERERRNEKIQALWLACYSTDEIAEACSCGKATVSEVCSEEFQKTLSNKPMAQHATDFDPPLYNVWKQQEKTPGMRHAGNSEVRWVDNLLYLYTDPFGIVVDPFGGSGSTIDLCKKRFRRYWVSDRKPIVEREQDIRLHDLTDGPPSLPRWQDVQLVYLDPPYWKQVEGDYSNDPTDLANMDLATFTETLAGIITGFAKKLPAGAKIAMLMQPTQWRAPEKRYTDHVANMLRAVPLPLHMRFQCPYESQQCTAQMVEWAKANKQCLVLSRELVVWEVS